VISAMIPRVHAGDDAETGRRRRDVSEFFLRLTSPTSRSARQSPRRSVGTVSVKSVVLKGLGDQAGW